MPKIMIIKYQQFAKTNNFSLSFHILFSPFLHIFPQDTSKSGFGGWAKMGKIGVGSPPPINGSINIYPDPPHGLHEYPEMKID